MPLTLVEGTAAGPFDKLKDRRLVSPDNTVTLGPHRLQLLPTETRQSYARAQVEVQERLDGSLAVFYQGQWVATKPAPATVPVLRARAGARPQGVTVVSTPASRRERPTPQPPLAVERAAKPAASHPWRRPFKEPRLTKSLDINSVS